MTSKKRLVSARQMEPLVDYLEAHRELALGRLRSRDARATSARLWAECANILNAEGGGEESRTSKEWQKWYTDYKSRLLNRVRIQKSNQTGTGGGPGTNVQPLSLSEERLYSLLGGGDEVRGRCGTPQSVVQINPVVVDSQHNVEVNDIIIMDYEPNSPTPVLPPSTPATQYEDVVEQSVERPTYRRRKRRRQSPVNTPMGDLERSTECLSKLEEKKIEVLESIDKSLQSLVEVGRSLAAALQTLRPTND